MRILVLQYIACEHPGVFSEVMHERGVEAHAVELDEGEPVPDWREFDAVLAMGGPVGAGDEAEHPWLAAEKQLVSEAVEAGRPFLDVCFGVQLLAAALSARVYPTERPEVGLLDVELTPEGHEDPLFAGLGHRLVSLQWHGDTFDLPPRRRPPGELAAGARSGVPGRRAGLRGPVPPRGHRRDGERVEHDPGLPGLTRRDPRGSRRGRFHRRRRPAGGRLHPRRGACSRTGSSSPGPHDEPPRRGMYLFVQSRLYSENGLKRPRGDGEWPRLRTAR